MERRRRRRRKKMTIFDFFKIRLLGFCTAELKSEDIFVLRRVRAFSGYSFCWLNPQTTCLFILFYTHVLVHKPVHTPSIHTCTHLQACAHTLMYVVHTHMHTPIQSNMQMNKEICIMCKHRLCVHNNNVLQQVCSPVPRGNI